MMKQYLYIIVMALGLITTSCNDDDPVTDQFTDTLSINVFGPCPVSRGDEIQIIGSRLDQVKAVRFPDNIDVTAFTLVSNHQIVCPVPDEASAGHLQLLGIDGSIVESVTLLSYIEPIKIKEVTPTQGLKAGDIITIKGEYVYNIASVVFAENVAVYADDFISSSRSEISLAVPKAAISGKITLSDGAEVATLIEWDESLQIAVANYNSLSDSEVSPGDILEVIGTDLDLIATVCFEGCEPTSEFTLNETATSLKVEVPSNAMAGTVKLTQYSGKVIFTDAITIPMASVSGVMPDSDLKVGDKVSVSGTNLNLIKKVIVPGDIEATFEVDNSGSVLEFIVPEGMGDGVVTLEQSETVKIRTPRISMHVEINETVIWNGTWENTSWGGMQELAWGGYDWSNFTEGRQIAFYLYSCGEGATLKPSDSSWTELSCGFVEIPQSDDMQRIVITPTAADITKLKENGMVVSGNNFILKMITIP